MKEIKAILEEECDFKRVFFAGANMKTKSDFETADAVSYTHLDVNKRQALAQSKKKENQLALAK